MMIRYLRILTIALTAAVQAAEDLPRLDNPMSVEYLEKSQRTDRPRLVFTPEILADLKTKLKTDPILQNRLNTIRLNASQILSEPLLKRKMVGRRLLHTSRQMLYRINMLGQFICSTGTRQFSRGSTRNC